MHVALSLGVAALLALAGGMAGAQAADVDAGHPAMRVQAVAEGTWFVQGLAALGSAANRNFISNAGFVVADDGVLVVDGLGSPALARQLLGLIRQQTPLPVKWVLVTHCHADHLYGLQVLQQAGAQIVAHPGCRDYLASDTARLRLQASRDELFPWIDEHTRLVTPDRWLSAEGPAGAELLPGRPRWQVLHAGPAHTPEDLVLLDRQTGVLFAGDIVFRGRIPFVGSADSRHWLAALDRILALQPRLLLPGHGPVSQDPLADLRLTRDYLAYLRQTMGAAARDMQPFDEAYDRTDWSRFRDLPLFAAANRMNAYNTYLLMEREPP